MIRYLNLIFLFFIAYTSFTQEICDNGIDDDNDLLIDLNDSDCICSSQIIGNPTSIIPNPSFENFNCYPTGYGDLYCADAWIQGSDGTSDYFNTSSFVGHLGGTSLVPFPNGNGAIGMGTLEGSSEYIGTCLLSPMIAGTQYTLQMEMAFSGILHPPNICSPPPVNSPTLDIFIYGHPTCGNLPFNAGFSCPLISNPNYIALSSSPLDLQTSNYQTLTFTFTPTININEIVIGAPCSHPTGWQDWLSWDPYADCVPYLIADNIILNTSTSFNILTIMSQGSICTNDLVLSSSVSTSGGTYQWYQNGIAIIGQTNSNLNVSSLGLGQATYQVRYSIGGNCYQSETIVNHSTTNTLTVNNAEICEGEIAELNVSGGTTYTWTPNTGLSSVTGSSVNASPSQTTIYTISSIDANGCISQTTSTVTVHNTSNININISPIPVETEVSLTASPSNYTYTWTTPDGLNINSNPLEYQFSGEDGTFQFIVETMNEYGCPYSNTIEITISSDLLLFVPNTFTPDGNEFNNIFKPVFSNNIDSHEYLFLIYNRWGELIFESKDPSIGWDGSYIGQLVQSGIYTWSLQWRNNAEKQLINGHVNLLR